MSKQIRIGDKVWSHHPRGGHTTGYASAVYRGLYGRERKIAVTPEAAREQNGYSVPVGQVYPGDPPPKKNPENTHV